MFAQSVDYGCSVALVRYKEQPALRGHAPRAMGNPYGKIVDWFGESAQEIRGVAFED